MATEKATPQNSEFNRKKIVKNGSGKDAIKTAREKYAKHKDKPTTAAADPKLKLPEALQQVDPKKISEVLPNMYKQLASVRNLMNAFNSTNNNAAPSGYAKVTLTDVFTGAMCILVKEYSYYTVLKVLFDTLSDDKYSVMSQEYQEIVLEGVVKLIKLAADYGEADIPVSTIPEITYGTGVPTPLYSSYDEVGDYYVQQYYTSTSDPYPGYIEYVGPSGDSVYLRRSNTDYPYDSAEQEIFTNAEYALARELSPYFNAQYLTIEVLYAALQSYCQTILDDNLDKQNGKNSKQNLLAMLTQFAGLAGTMGKLVQSSHLPQSVLDVASMTKTIDEHIKNIGKIKKLKDISKSAFDPASVLNSGLVSSLSSIFKGSSKNNVAQISQIANTVINGIT